MEGSKSHADGVTTEQFDTEAMSTWQVLLSAPPSTEPLPRPPGFSSSR
ncbi:MAG TPA: hypothetical protein PKA64_17185 [Myxococcota bacterium]|nr:hypothetical protein [Myxococcota bacterium]